MPQSEFQRYYFSFLLIKIFFSDNEGLLLRNRTNFGIHRISVQ